MDPGYDIIIVGAGPVGLYAAFCAGMRSLSVAIVDSLPMAGGQLAAFYPRQTVYDVPGHAGQTAQTIIDQLVRQAGLANPTYHLNEAIQHIQGDLESGFRLTTPKSTLHAKGLILAMGVGSLTAKMPSIAGDCGAKVFTGLPSPDQVVGKRVAVWGTGEQVAAWCADLKRVASSVMVIQHRPLTTDLDCVILNSHEVAAIDNEHIVVKNLNTSALEKHPMDVLLLALGWESDLSSLSKWGVSLQGNAIAVDHTMQTTRRGIFAAGDICVYPGKLKLIANGFGEAATAVNHLCTLLRPSERTFPGHSTSIATKRLPGLRGPA